VINRVRHGPAWADTLLIWAHNENGGYYDHVAPPAGRCRPTTSPATAWSRSRPRSLRSLLKALFPGYVRQRGIRSALAVAFSAFAEKT
jgi:Phosphoesterase family